MGSYRVIADWGAGYLMMMMMMLMMLMMMDGDGDRDDDNNDDAAYHNYHKNLHDMTCNDDND